MNYIHLEQSASVGLNCKVQLTLQFARHITLWHNDF